jgi:hypothetical protein
MMTIIDRSRMRLAIVPTGNMRHVHGLWRADAAAKKSFAIRQLLQSAVLLK